tara:strand:- start:167 stop:835 length:669 start_codon:yes stop_codon:yes gene_type:complete
MTAPALPHYHINGTAMLHASRAKLTSLPQVGLLLALLLGLNFVTTAPVVAQEAATAPFMETLDLENTLYLDLEYGRVVIEMMPEMAPKHVARIKELVREGFYDGVVFHRVIDGFMAQTGDPRGDGTGGSGQNIPAEFNDGVHVRGAVSMARSSNINSADSQWFIVLDESDFLNGQYTYWGQVVSGMEFVDQIRKGDPNNNGSVPYPDRIIQLRVAADVKEGD